MPIVSEVDFAKRINVAKRLLPWHREYLDRLLKYFMLMTPDQRREIIISKGYGDPVYIRFVRTKDRANLLQQCKEKSNDQ